MNKGLRNSILNLESSNGVIFSKGVRVYAYTRSYQTE